MIISRLIKAMCDKSMTQKQLAQATGLTEAAISKYLCGKQITHEESLVKICKALDVSADWLLGIEKEVRNDCN